MNTTHIIYDFNADQIILGTKTQALTMPEAKIVGDYQDEKITLYQFAHQWMNPTHFRRLWTHSFPTRPIKELTVQKLTQRKQAYLGYESAFVYLGEPYDRLLVGGSEHAELIYPFIYNEVMPLHLKNNNVWEFAAGFIDKVPIIAGHVGIDDEGEYKVVFYSDYMGNVQLARQLAERALIELRKKFPGAEEGDEYVYDSGWYKAGGIEGGHWEYKTAFFWIDGQLYSGRSMHASLMQMWIDDNGYDYNEAMRILEREPAVFGHIGRWFLDYSSEPSSHKEGELIAIFWSHYMLGSWDPKLVAALKPQVLKALTKYFDRPVREAKEEEHYRYEDYGDAWFSSSFMLEHISRATEEVWKFIWPPGGDLIIWDSWNGDHHYEVVKREELNALDSIIGHVAIGDYDKKIYWFTRGMWYGGLPHVDLETLREELRKATGANEMLTKNEWTERTAIEGYKVSAQPKYVQPFLDQMRPNEEHGLPGDCINPHCDRIFSQEDENYIDMMDGWFTCPKCDLTYNYYSHQLAQGQPGGSTRAGITPREMGVIGEHIIAELGFIPGVGEVIWRAEDYNHPIDFIIGDFAVEVKTNHSEAQPRFKMGGGYERQSKLNMAEELGLRPGLIGVRLNFYTNHADIFFREGFTDTWIGSTAMPRVTSFDFSHLNPFPNPNNVPPVNTMPEDDTDDI